MKLFDELRRLFSPYEMAVAGELIFLLCAIAGVAVHISKGSAEGLVVLWMIAVIVGITAVVLSRCPTCGKSPYIFYLTNNRTALGGLLFGGRFWPERTCSECGTRLGD